jgi:homocitrate synthase
MDKSKNGVSMGDPPSSRLNGPGPLNFQIIESTLREGEQFANAFFDTKTKIEIARALDDFGVDYIELTSPAASEQSFKDCQIISRLGLKAKILTHVRCSMAVIPCLLEFISD